MGSRPLLIFIRLCEVFEQQGIRPSLYVLKRVKASGEISCTNAGLINVYESGKVDDSSIRCRTRGRLAM